MAISKVIYGDDTLIDITDSTIESSNMLNGTVGYNSAGIRTIGSYVDSDEKVKQTPDTSNNDLRILLSNSANDTEETNIVKKNTNLKYNPSTGNLQTTKINGVTVGNSPKFTDTNTTYTFAEGATNGAFTVTPSTSGATAQAVNIHGLGSAAYTASTDYIASSNNGLQTIKVTRGASVSTATRGYWAAMCSSSQTGSPTLPTPGKWWHVLSMDWNDSDDKAWWSQLALPTRDGDGVWYRKSDNTNTIDNISWNRLADGDSLGNANNALKVNNLEVKTAVPENAVFTDTWRNIKVNGSEKFGNATSTGAVDFVNGTGTTVTYTSSGKKISINTTYGTEANTACQGNDSRLSDARTPTSHPHGNITNDGKITSDTAQASGDKLVIIDADNNKVARSKIALSAEVSSQSQTTKFLREDGTWSAPTYTTISAATSNAYGGIKIGFTQTEKKYPVQLSSGKAYVEVPWTDTSGNDKVAKAGDTMTGNLTMGTPSQSSFFSVGLTIQDVRGVTTHPLDTANKVFNTFFSQTDMPDTKWWSGIYLKGWTGGYSSWELVGAAANDDGSTRPLYVRSSNKSTSWGSWRQIYDSSNKPSKSDVGLGNVANINQSKAIKNITRDGTTFTATCLDNTTLTFDQQDEDTKNTAGALDNTGKKLFLVGAITPTDNPQTYSNSKVYIGTDNCLYSNGAKVLTAHQDISGKVNKSGDTMTGHLTIAKVGTTANVDTYLYLGNATVAASGGSRGLLEMYATNAYRTRIYHNVAPTANRNLYLPDATGTVALKEHFSANNIFDYRQAVPRTNKNVATGDYSAEGYIIFTGTANGAGANLNQYSMTIPNAKAGDKVTLSYTVIAGSFTHTDSSATTIYILDKNGSAISGLRMNFPSSLSQGDTASKTYTLQDSDIDDINNGNVKGASFKGIQVYMRQNDVFNQLVLAIRVHYEDCCFNNEYKPFTKTNSQLTESTKWKTNNTCTITSSQAAVISKASSYDEILIKGEIANGTYSGLFVMIHIPVICLTTSNQSFRGGWQQASAFGGAIYFYAKKTTSDTIEVSLAEGHLNGSACTSYCKGTVYYR